MQYERIVNNFETLIFHRQKFEQQLELTLAKIDVETDKPVLQPTTATVLSENANNDM
jgi:hypothetical protein